MPDPAPTVSVVIPAYNRAASITAAVESVLRQSRRDFELIVVDDGSSDGTLEAAGRVQDPRLRLIAAPRNLGAAGARNLGAAEARGAWIAFQDSDDEWLPTKLEKQMARLEAPGATPYVGAYCGLLTLGWLDEKPGERLRLRYKPDLATAPTDGDILEPLLWGNLISTQTLVVRRELFQALGAFDEETTPIEDWDFVIRLAQQGPIAFVDEPLVHQRFSPNSITRNLGRALSSRERLVENNLAVYARYPAILAQQYSMLAGGYHGAGDVAKARRYIALARRTDPGRARHWTKALYISAIGLWPARRRA